MMVGVNFVGVRLSTYDSSTKYLNYSASGEVCFFSHYRPQVKRFTAGMNYNISEPTEIFQCDSMNEILRSLNFAFHLMLDFA